MATYFVRFKGFVTQKIEGDRVHPFMSFDALEYPNMDYEQQQALNNAVGKLVEIMLSYGNQAVEDKKKTGDLPVKKG